MEALTDLQTYPKQGRQHLAQEQEVRTRFALSQFPGFITYSIIVINVVVYFIVGKRAGNWVDIDIQTVLFAGGQSTLWMQTTGEYWRIFTAMFLHFNLIHLGLNMLSLFFIGPAVETAYGKWRYLVIYFSSGIIGGIATYLSSLMGGVVTYLPGIMRDIATRFFVDPRAISAGASGAIFGVFGALGAFYLMNRRSLGASGKGAIGNWVFLLALNLIWGIAVPGIGITDHIGGLVTGMLVSFLFIPYMTRSIT